MNIYLISQNVNVNYDTYDSAIVTAINKENARRIHPTGVNIKGYNKKTGMFDLSWWEDDYYTSTYGSWCKPEDVKVELIGTTDLIDKEDVIIASFNAG